VIAFETGVADVADPLGGSALVESWTEELASRASALIGRVDALGGAVAAIETGFLSREIDESAYVAQRELEQKERLVVGVNAFRSEADPPPVLTVDPQIERDQVERLQAFRAARDSRAAQSALSKLEGEAKENRNPCPRSGRRRAGATLGEVVLAQEVFEASPGG
jgi:methylmalonyl-CoA mutase N-terminal domain/subunit